MVVRFTLTHYFFWLKSDSTHHFFWNACTKSGSLLFSVFRLLPDCVCLYTYEFWLSRWKIVRSSVILLLPLFVSSGRWWSITRHNFPTISIKCHFFTNMIYCWWIYLTYTDTHLTVISWSKKLSKCLEGNSLSGTFLTFMGYFRTDPPFFNNSRPECVLYFIH